MRLGLIADIHGNRVALEAVLGELAREGVGRLVCLGDVAALGPRPTAVIGRLREIGCPSVLGNTDGWLLGATAFRADDPDLRPLAELTAWAGAQLGEADRAYLRACPLTLEVALDADTTLLAFHGSPRSYDEVIAAGTPTAELLALLGGHRAPLLAGGHTHRQLLRRDGDAFFVNPGSVGLPGIGPAHPLLEVNRGVAWAEDAIIEADAARGLRIELRRLPLALDHLFADAEASGMPHVGWWRGLWDHADR